MPELPEVEMTVDGVKKRALGLSIRDAWSDYDSPFYAGKEEIKDRAYFKRFRAAVKGAKIIKASRRGKNVLIGLSNGTTILIHMKMTGHLVYGRYAFKDKKWTAVDDGPLRADPYNRFVHFVLSLSNGKHLALSDMRKFAKVTLIETADLESTSHLASHGPEPLDESFGLPELKKALLKRPNRPIKTALMDAETIAGIGNIYSDEILWLSGIHPLEPIGKIPAAKWSLILQAIKKTLRHVLDSGNDPLSDYRNIDGVPGTWSEKRHTYRQTGKRCDKKNCGGTIERIKVGGRSAHFCSKHQKLI